MHRTSPSRFEFDNVGDFLPGAFADVWLLSSPRRGVVSIPVSSLTEEQGLKFVYLLIADEIYKKQEIHVGQATANAWRYSTAWPRATGW